MTKLMDKLSKENIRSSMNLVFTLMKFISMLLELAPDNVTARETLISTADSLFQQTAVLGCELNEYVKAMPVDNEGFCDSNAEIERR